jgi:uncharacterized tellurite resistance protein B-like protein
MPIAWCRRRARCRRRPVSSGVDPDADEDAAFFAVATKKLCAGAIFCEMAMADGTMTPEEQERVRYLLLLRFGLDDAETDALFKIGQQAPQTARASRA